MLVARLMDELDGRYHTRIDGVEGTVEDQERVGRDGYLDSFALFWKPEPGRGAGKNF